MGRCLQVLRTQFDEQQPLFEILQTERRQVFPLQDILEANLEQGGDWEHA